MERRDFISSGIMLPFLTVPYSPRQLSGITNEVVIEKAVQGQPHKGKVLAAIQPHCDDIPLFAAGTVAKLIREGYEGYLIRTTNDDHAGKGETIGDIVKSNSADNQAVAKALGLKKVFDLGYRNHMLDNYSMQDIRGRLIFLFRMLKVDTIICYDPWGHYEENPDHYITAQAVEAARWMAGGSRDYPEHFEAGLEPHSVIERYYFARGPQLVNRIVDITGTIEQKIDANLANVTQGPAGENGSLLKKNLEEKGKYLPLLGSTDEEANRNYIKHFVLDLDSQYLRGIPSDKEAGSRYKLEWAECFHYFGPGVSALPEYLSKNARIK
ncbi:MAG TPA: PIG-L family deacetylase [Cyclobacteriaceae bacterium]|nr:PIG-L family deacetylase [Cyclobacteriaceae bacterium]